MKKAKDIVIGYAVIALTLLAGSFFMAALSSVAYQ